MIWWYGTVHYGTQESQFTELEKAFAAARRRSLAQESNAAPPAVKKKEVKKDTPAAGDGGADKAKAKAVSSKASSVDTPKVDAHHAWCEGLDGWSCEKPGKHEQSSRMLVPLRPVPACFASTIDLRIVGS